MRNQVCWGDVAYKRHLRVFWSAVGNVNALQKMDSCLRVRCQSVFVGVLPNANFVCESLRGLDSSLRWNDRVVSGVWQQRLARE